MNRLACKRRLVNHCLLAGSFLVGLLLTACNIGFDPQSVETIDQRDGRDPDTGSRDLDRGDASDIQEISDVSPFEVLDVPDVSLDTGDMSLDGEVSADLVDVPADVVDIEPDIPCDPAAEVFRLGPEDALLDLGWTIETDAGEGSVLRAPAGGSNAAAAFSIDITCPGTYHVWLRGFDAGTLDSFYAQVDGVPNVPAVTELNCDNGQGGGFVWAELNWRDRNDPPCVYVQSPWVQSWDAGTHFVVITPRESETLARIIVTGDSNFAPGPTE